MLLNLPASLSKFIIPQLCDLARETGFIQRESSKMGASEFVLTIVSAAISGKGSYNQLAFSLGQKTGDPMCRQAMADRLDNDSTIEFLTTVHNALIEGQIQSVETSLKGSRILRVLVEDSSGLAMPKSNADAFPAHGNHYGPTAGVKIDFAYDILSRSVIAQSLHSATEQDKSIGKETLVYLKPGDLLLRDMGYFCLAEFTHAESLGADWLSRLPLTTYAFLENGTSIEKHLKKSKLKVVDIAVKVGSKEEKSARLVAVRADSEVVNQRRRERRAKAKKEGKVADPRALVLDGWHIMVTSLCKETFSGKDLAAIYRLRWGIEIQFRAWKQSTAIGDSLNRNSSENHLMALILGGMIAQLIATLVSRFFGAQIDGERISCEKLADVINTYLLGITRMEDLMEIAVDSRHIKRDYRKAETPLKQGLRALS